MVFSESEFNKAVESCGFPRPSNDVYKHIAAGISDFSREELVMFLTQLIHESGGFQFREELAYKGNRNHGAYHGRGFIQLTWGANYKVASEGLGMGDKLLKNPEIVANDTKMAVLVSVWYWKARIRPQMQGRVLWWI